ncbi:MAG: hypothetical protein U5K72_11440 [Balneolaceae bacterium]|nr:hypothetical protein [Balneolaceae bacterium]
MNELKPSTKDYNIYDILEKERIAEEYLYVRNSEKSAELFQDIVYKECTKAMKRMGIYNRWQEQLYSK